MLTQLQQVYDKENYPCTYINGNAESPIDQLLLYIGKDYKEREQLIQITSQEQELAAEITKSAHVERYFRVQFKFSYPFTVEQIALGQISSLVHFINNQADFPGFELDELENRISFRYVWLLSGKSVDSLLVKSLTGIITLLVSMFCESLEKVSSGKATFDDLLKEIIDTAKQLSESDQK